MVQIFQMGASAHPLPTLLRFWVNPCFAKWGSIQQVVRADKPKSSASDPKNLSLFIFRCFFGWKLSLSLV